LYFKVKHKFLIMQMQVQNNFPCYLAIKVLTGLIPKGNLILIES
jgi:hypothetical protein